MSPIAAESLGAFLGVGVATLVAVLLTHASDPGLLRRYHTLYLGSAAYAQLELGLGFAFIASVLVRGSRDAGGLLLGAFIVASAAGVIAAVLALVAVLDRIATGRR